MQWKSPPACELCQSKLIGAAEISSKVEEDAIVVTVRESLLVDWSFCPMCKSIVCKASCLDRRSGYCRACANESETDAFDFRERVVARETSDDILSAETIF